jgi:hypothetical protein
MKGCVPNIQRRYAQKPGFQARYIREKNQLVLMSLRPKISEETHTLHRFIRVETGDGVVILARKEFHRVAVRIIHDAF